jgi:hypothetical protein
MVEAMPRIAIQLPPVEAEDKVEVEVTVNGKRRKFCYRIEIFAWEEYAEPEEDRVGCLRRIIGNYDKDWRLVQIGEATDREISIVFEQRRSLTPDTV